MSWNKQRDLSRACANCGDTEGKHAAHGNFCPSGDWYSKTETFRAELSSVTGILDSLDQGNALQQGRSLRVGDEGGEAPAIASPLQTLCANCGLEITPILDYADSPYWNDPAKPYGWHHVVATDNSDGEYQTGCTGEFDGCEAEPSLPVHPMGREGVSGGVDTLGRFHGSPDDDQDKESGSLSMPRNRCAKGQDLSADSQSFYTSEHPASEFYVHFDSSTNHFMEFVGARLADAAFIKSAQFWGKVSAKCEDVSLEEGYRLEELDAERESLGVR